MVGEKPDEEGDRGEGQTSDDQPEVGVGRGGVMGAIELGGDGLAMLEMLLDNLGDVFDLDMGVPGLVGKDEEHGTVATFAKATGGFDFYVWWYLGLKGFEDGGRSLLGTGLMLAN